jgi:hypothetical protein
VPGHPEIPAPTSLLPVLPKSDTMASMDRVCQFLVGLPLRGLWTPGEAQKLETAICGEPAQWELVINGCGPIWVCAEHYDVLIAQGWSEA